jgi:hypothetical protein
MRRTGASATIFTAIAAGVVSMVSVAWHHDLAQAAPAAALGTLRWQVSKVAFDACKVFTIFCTKNLVMVILHPSRYGQLRAPLVEQRVPDEDGVEEAAVAAPAGVADSDAAALGAAVSSDAAAAPLGWRGASADGAAATPACTPATIDSSGPP